MNERCLTILLNKLLSKEKDPGSFTIPCDIGHLHINNALADLGSSISLMPYTVYEKLGLGEPKLTRMSLELADRSIQYPRGIAKSVLIKIDKFILLIDFVILDMREDSKILIILGRPFLATARAMIDVVNKKITLGVGNEEELLEDDQLDSFLVNNLEESIDLSNLESYGKANDSFESRTPIRCIEQINTPYSESLETKKPNKTQNEHLYSASANEIDKKRPVLKDLPSHLEYTKQDAKPRLIIWVLLLQGINTKIKDKKGAENLAADHLSRLENPNIGELVEDKIADKFTDKHLMILKAKLNEEEPWYAD
uniref:Reverse transcriptase domain-containing protein n=1 Tax=Tanacetum cinerariifolium TaxID=118510 RepID=A0A6L2JEH1_TANCI|nr:hypothetical protein [Tanacetum cinerariifolium]